MKAQDLRNSILQLAIQGKLVPQNPNDEPADVLYAKIQAEKQKLIKTGKIKKYKPLPSISEGEIPFEIPSSWKWARLAECSDIYTGNSISENIKETKYKKVKEGYNYIGTKDVNFDCTINYDTGVKIPYNERNFRYAKEGSVLICIEGGSAGRKISILNKVVCFGNKLCSVSALGFNNKYLYYFLQSKYFRNVFNENTSGIIGGVSVNKFKELFFPLPPLGEQQRIVAKIEELEPYIKKYDEIECELTELDNKFPRQLRKSVLKCATEGKLIGHTGKFCKYILKDLIDFGPKNGFSPKSVNFKTSTKSLTLTATTYGKFDGRCFKYINEKVDRNSYLWLKKGDILIQRGNSIEYVGVSAIFDGNDGEFIYPDLMVKIRANNQLILTDFLHLSLNSPAVRDYFRKQAGGTSGNMPKINHKIILETELMVPALKEQHRIVAKVNEFLAYCDKLESAEKYIIEKSVEPINNEWLIDKSNELYEQDGWVNPDRILDELGIVTILDRSLNKGRIEYVNNQFRICLRDRNDNWTKVHELVHYANDNAEIKLYGAVGRKDETSLSKSKEVNTDAITAEILMPENAVINFLKQENIKLNGLVVDKAIRKMAKQFKVSDVAVKIRLQNMNYKTK